MQRQRTALFFIFILFIQNYHSVDALKILKKKVKQDGLQSAEIAGQCMKALTENIPPSFCWKKGADFGTIPQACPEGYFRSLALCYEYCIPGYTHVLGICWSGCDAGYIDHGATCFKNLFDWYFKNAYIPDAFTNFSDAIKCSPGNYKMGALCYRDCKNIGMENCGIGACVADAASCGAEILSMALDTLIGIATLLSTVLTGGAVAAAKKGIETGIKKLGTSVIKQSLNSLKKIFTSELKEKLISKAKKWVANKARDIAKGLMQEQLVGVICETIWKSAEEKTLAAPDISGEDLLNAVDIFNVQGIAEGCSNTADTNGAIDCAKNVLTGLSTFDPTGLLSIAATFMKPICDVPGGIETEKPLQSNVDLLINDNCVYVFEACDYMGKYAEVCENAITLGELSKNVSSYKVGKSVSGMFYPQFDFGGSGYPFGPGQEVKCLQNYTNPEVTEIIYDKWMKSIRLHISHCFIISFKTPQSGFDASNDHFCQKEEADVSLPYYEGSTFMRSYNFKQGVKLIVYSEPNFGGTEWEVPLGSLNPTALVVNPIRSYKLHYLEDDIDKIAPPPVPEPKQPTPAPVAPEDVINVAPLADSTIIEYTPL